MLLPHWVSILSFFFFLVFYFFGGGCWCACRLHLDPSCLVFQELMQITYLWIPSCPIWHDFVRGFGLDHPPMINTVVFSYLNILLLDIPTDSKRFKKWCPDMASGWEKPKHHDIAFSLDHPGILPPELCQCLIINNVYTSYVYIYIYVCVCVYIAMCSVWMDHGGSWLIYHELIHWYLVLPHFLDPKMLILTPRTLAVGSGGPQANCCPTLKLKA